MLFPLSTDYFREKWGHAGFQRYFANMSWMFVGRVFVMIVSFVVNIYMARYLGPGDYGLLNYTFSFVGLFGFMASLGIESVIGREIIKNHDRKDEFIGTSFFLKLFGSVAAIVTILIAARLSTDDPLLLGLISLYSLVYIFNAFGIIDTYFQSQVLSKYPTIIMIGGGILSAILKIAVMAWGGSVLWLVGVYTLESIIVTLGLLYVFVLKGHSFRGWRFDGRIALNILKDSLPLMLSGIAVTVYMDIDQIMIKNLMGNEAAGVYAVAVKLSEFWYFIPGVIVGAVYPAIVNARIMSNELYENRLKKLYFLMFWLSTFIAFCTMAFGYHIVHMLYGIEYLGAVNALSIYVWAGIAVSLSFVMNHYLIVENYTKISALTTVIGAVVNVALNIFLIPKYGLSGAASATLISYFISTFSIVFFRSTRAHVFLMLKSIVQKT